jgi:exosortase F-associated protein
MLQKILKNKRKFAFSILLISIFIGIRAFEKQIFYDPFLIYFKREYAHLPFPKIDNVKLFLNLTFRYLLNSIVSIALLWVLFRDTSILKFSGFLYFIFGIVLIVSFFLVFHFFGEESKMEIFYIRRFIIQPLFVLLFIPAFYYQNRNK